MGQPRRRRKAREEGVSPVIGTMFVFVIVVASMASALVFGVPAIQELQDRAAMDDMSTQLEGVREEAEKLTVDGAGVTIHLAPADGAISLTEGTRTAVSISYDGSSTQTGLALAWGKGGRKKATNVQRSACDFQVQAWEDGDDKFTLTATDCPPPDRYTSTEASNFNGACWASNNKIGGKEVGCLLVVRLDDPTQAQRVSASTAIARVGTTDQYVVTLDQPMADKDWFVQLSEDPRQGDNDALYAKWYTFGMDQLRWEREGLATWIEGGAIFGRRNEAQFILHDPLFQENLLQTPVCAANPNAADCEPTFYVRIIRFEGVPTSISSAVGTLNVDLRHNQTHATANDGVVSLRLDFLGDGATLWCEALVRRAVPSGYMYDDRYETPAGDPTCAGDPVTGMQSVRYHNPRIVCAIKANCSDGDNTQKTFQVYFTEVQFDVGLRP